MRTKAIQITTLFILFFIGNTMLAQTNTYTSTEYKSFTVKGFCLKEEPKIQLFSDGHIDLLLSKETIEDSSEIVQNEFWINFTASLSKDLKIEVIKKNNQHLVILNATEQIANKVKYYLENYFN